jgi:hypothetical protein
MKKYSSPLAVALLIMVGVQLVVAQDKSVADQQVTDPEIQQNLDKNLVQFRSSDRKVREAAVRELHEKLTAVANTRSAYPKGESRKKLSQEFTQLYTQTKDKDFDDPSLRLGLIYDLARYGDNEVAKPFILWILDRGNKDERAEALRGLGSPGGVSGDDLYAKIEDLANRKIITDQAKTTYLSRIDKNRALVKILGELRTTKDKRKFLYSAWTLQDSYQRPADFKEILPRLKELGLTQNRSFDGKSDGLFWINAELLATYVDMADGSDLKLALGMMAEHGSLTRPVSAPALMRRLSHTDPQVRALAAQALVKVMGRSQVDKNAINAALNSALQNEQDPQAKKSIQDSIARIARADQDWQKFLERTKKDRERR